MNVVEIPLDQIDAGERLREIDEDWAQLIAASMGESGQHTPLWVRQPDRKGMHQLVAGGHRLRALQIAGIETALCTVHKVGDLQARMLEIDENLVRRELSALDRATFLAERKRVYEELHPETKRGGDRTRDQNEQVFVLVESFTASTADRLGVSRRYVEKAVARFQRLPADVRRMIHATWIADSGSQLDALAKLTPDQQRQVAGFIANGNRELRTVAGILRRVEDRAAPEPATAFEKFLRLWRTADAATRARIAEHIDAVQPKLRRAA